MARIVVLHDIDDLASDMRKIATGARKDMRAVVRNGIKVGNSIARDYAKARSGPHGKNFFKRYTTEMHGDVTFGGATGISGEYGERTGGIGVGGGHRSGGGLNLDLPNSADQIAPAFYGEVKRLPDGWFW